MLISSDACGQQAPTHASKRIAPRNGVVHREPQSKRGCSECAITDVVALLELHAMLLGVARAPPVDILPPGKLEQPSSRMVELLDPKVGEEVSARGFFLRYDGGGRSARMPSAETVG